MTLFLLGLILILLGFLHLLNEVAQVEPKLLQSIQQVSNSKPLLSFFREIWFIGRTPFTFIVLVFLIFINWKMGLIAGGVFLAIIGTEYLVKSLYHRKRPFTSDQAIAMLQPIEPLDSSFPSGDALRVWYLALILPAATGSILQILVAAISLAVLVTLGRLVMGVHYITDTLAGAGLGFIGAGTTIWLWNFLNIL